MADILFGKGDGGEAIYGQFFEGKSLNMVFFKRNPMFCCVPYTFLLLPVIKLL